MIRIRIGKGEDKGKKMCVCVILLKDGRKRNWKKCLTLL